MIELEMTFQILDASNRIASNTYGQIRCKYYNYDPAQKQFVADAFLVQHQRQQVVRMQYFVMRT